jgi:hypothetical protein
MVAPNQAVLYVELAPCPACVNWLNGMYGAGAVTLNVWYRWSYPGPPALPAIGAAPALPGPGAAAMNVFHGMLLPNELLDINGATW